MSPAWVAVVLVGALLGACDSSRYRHECNTTGDCRSGLVCVHEHAHDVNFDTCEPPCALDRLGYGFYACGDSPSGGACKTDDGAVFCPMRATFPEWDAFPLYPDAGAQLDGGAVLTGADAFPVLGAAARTFALEKSTIVSGVHLSLSDTPGFCSTGPWPLQLWVHRDSWGSQGLAPGTFQIPRGTSWEPATSLSLNRAPAAAWARSGTVTLTSVTPDGVAGSFDVVLAEADGGSSALSGTFATPGCP